MISQTPWNRVDRLRAAAIAALAVLVTGCAFDGAAPDEEAAVATADQEILGEVTVNSCSSTVDKFFRDAAFVARTVVASDAFVACVDDAVAHEYVRCTFDGSDGDPNLTTEQHTRNALRASRSVNDIALTCDTSDDNWGTAGVGSSPGYYGLEQFNMQTLSIDQANQLGKPACTGSQTYAANGCRENPYPYGLREVAATIIHENLHQHGYTHGGSGGACQGTGYSDQLDSMPWVIDQCLVHIVQESMTTCGDICSTRSGDDISSCRTRGRLDLVTELGAATCEESHDPGQTGLGALQLGDDGLVALDIHPHGARFGGPTGGWLSHDYDELAGRGNLDPSAQGDEMVMQSPWGLGVLGWDVHNASAAERTSTRALAPYGTTLAHWGDGGTLTWTLGAGDRVLGVGRYSSAAQYGTTAVRDEILVRSSSGLGLLNVHAGALRTRNRYSNGSVLENGWTIRADDELLAQGDFNGDGQTDLLFRSTVTGQVAVVSRTAPAARSRCSSGAPSTAATAGGGSGTSRRAIAWCRSATSPGSAAICSSSRAAGGSAWSASRPARAS